jgi:lipopolysaccharide transport system permease protein
VSADEAHLRTYGPAGPRLSSELTTELWEYREVLFAFVVRQLKVRYKQAAIGVGWSILQPLFASLIFALFLGRFAHLQSEGVQYFVFAMTGMVLWTFFSTGLSTAAESLIRDSAMVRKVYFPRQILPLSAVGAALLDVPASTIVLIGAVLLTGGRPSWTWLLIPLPVFIVLLAATGLGLALSALNVYYRDVRHALPFLLQVVMFSSPVIYSLSVVPAKWRVVYEVLNPIAVSVDDMRRVLLHGTLPELWINLAAIAWLAVILLAGSWLFRSLERDFADRL